jgi:hypothetical protein
LLVHDVTELTASLESARRSRFGSALMMENKVLDLPGWNRASVRALPGALGVMRGRARDDILRSAEGRDRE